MPVMLEALDPGAPPVMPPVTVGVPQLYVVPVGTMFPPPFAGVTMNPIPLHVDAVCGVVTDGVGVTVTVTVKFAPVQLPDLGVTV